MNLLKLARMSLCVLLFLDVKCAASRIASCCTLITSGVNCISCRGVDLRCPVPRAVPIHEQYSWNERKYSECWYLQAPEVRSSQALHAIGIR